MKADIPDSIIISRDEDGVLHHSYYTTDQQLVPFEATEYIRKDALLDWLYPKITIFEDKYVRRAFQEVIDKIESM